MVCYIKDIAFYQFQRRVRYGNFLSGSLLIQIEILLITVSDCCRSAIVKNKFAKISILGHAITREKNLR